jgi:hypothetical protein
LEELNQLKQQYNQVYSYLEQKNAESLSYYNEIQRLNGVLSELNQELLNAKSYNENLIEQYDNLVKECQLEQKIVEDLNQQINELNKTFMSGPSPKTGSEDIKEESKSPVTVKVTCDLETQTDNTDLDLKIEVKEVETKEENSALNEESIRNEIEKKYESELGALQTKLVEKINYYETILSEQNENFKENLLNEEKLQMSLSKELSDLRSHLTEVSDNYARDMYQCEDRESKLRLALTKSEETVASLNEQINSLRY